MPCNTLHAIFECDVCKMRLTLVVSATRTLAKLAEIHRKQSPQCKANTIVRDQ